MTGARLPKMKKSYHSNAVPADDAMMTRAIDQGLRCCCSAMLAMILSPRGRGIARASLAARWRSVQLADRLLEMGDGDPKRLTRIWLWTSRGPAGVSIWSKLRWFLRRVADAHAAPS